MSKYVSKSMKKNLPLTTKRAGKGFYKGKGCTSEGRINSKARFIVNPLKRLELVVPDLSGFRLKPYISSSASRFPPEERHNPVAA
jgi:large subunit ribosomal protein L41